MTEPETLEHMKKRLADYQYSMESARPQNRKWMQMRINTLTIKIAREEARL